MDPASHARRRSTAFGPAEAPPLCRWTAPRFATLAVGLALISAACSSSDEPLSLDTDEQERLWAIEHHGNVLSQLGISRLTDALERGDPDAVTHLMAENFRAQLDEQPRTLDLKVRDFLDVRRGHHGEQATSRHLDRDAFATWLLQMYAPFEGAPASKFGIKSLGPVDHDRWDGPWDGRFAMDLYGPRSGGGTYSVSLQFTARFDRPSKARVDEPGWLHGWTVEQLITAEAERPLFEEVAAEWGVDTDGMYDNWNEAEKLSNTGGVFAADFDRDGYVDLLITDVDLPGARLLAGGPEGRFRDVTDRVGSTGRETSLNAAFVDLDDDGWPDFVFESGRILRNAEGDQLELVSDRSNLPWLLHGPSAPSATITGIIPADFDRDGRMDLYVTRSARGPREDAGWLGDSLDPIAGNQLLQNLGGWEFRDVTRRSGTGAEGRSTFSAAWLDADSDGWPDLYVINEFGNGVLLVNRGDGTFTQQPLADGPGDFGSMGVVAGDMDNDGHVDVFTSNMYSKAGNRIIDNIRPGAYPDEVMQGLRRLVGGSQMYRNLGTLDFEPVGQQMQVRSVGWSWGTTLADLDNDGWLDLYATSGYMSRDIALPDG